MAEGYDLSFVNLGITIEHLNNSISIFGFRIAYYGIIIGTGMLAGIWLAQADAKRRGQNPEDYLDFALYAICLLYTSTFGNPTIPNFILSLPVQKPCKLWVSAFPYIVRIHFYTLLQI